MPERLTGRRRHDTSEVQGEGSYVYLRPLLAGEALEFAENNRKMSEEERLEWRRRLEEDPRLVWEMLAPLVVGWNWVDDNGAPLRPPAEDPQVVDQLTMPEVSFLIDLFREAGILSKESPGGEGEQAEVVGVSVDRDGGCPAGVDQVQASSVDAPALVGN